MQHGRWIALRTLTRLPTRRRWPSGLEIARPETHRPSTSRCCRPCPQRPCTRSASAPRQCPTRHGRSVPPRAHRWRCRRTSCSSRWNDITVRQQGRGLNAGTARVMVSWPGLALAGCWPPAPGESRQSGPRRGHAPMDCRSEAAYELTCLKIRQTMWYRSRSQSVAWKPAPGPRGVAPWLSASTFTAHNRFWSPRIGFLGSYGPLGSQ